MTYVRPKDLLQLRGVNKMIFSITESPIFLSMFKARLHKLMIHDLRQTVELYLPNLSARVHQELKLANTLRNNLPLTYFNFKLPLWISFIRPHLPKVQFFMLRNPHLSSSTNIFQRQADFKEHYLKLTSFERKCLKWEARLATLFNRKKCGMLLTKVLTDSIASNSRTS